VIHGRDVWLSAPLAGDTRARNGGCVTRDTAQRANGRNRRIGAGGLAKNREASLGAIRAGLSYLMLIREPPEYPWIKLTAVLDGGDLLGHVIRDFAPEFVLQGHHQLDGVKAVGPQIVDKAGILGHLGFVDAKKLDDDLLNPLGDVAHSLASFPYPESQTRRGRGRYPAVSSSAPCCARPAASAAAAAPRPTRARDQSSSTAP
jgi:hypothetical protein